MKSLVVFLSLTVAGCVSTNEIQQSANVWHLDVEGRGIIGRSQTDETVMKRAAELTIQHGYSHFILSDAQTGGSTALVGTMGGASNTDITLSGNTAYATTTYAPVTPIYSRSRQVGVTVVMFKAGEPGAATAIDAAATLARLQ